ncbi:MAG TPA: hypothetical protein VJ773_05520 [Gemmatimonadales bacterium]|nr:hypothetical protein [Gemmatimonadales bacterium]
MTDLSAREAAHQPGGAELEFLVVAGLGHVWPGGPRLLPARVVGQGSDRLHGSEAAWAFLSHHAGPRAG